MKLITFQQSSDSPAPGLLSPNGIHDLRSAGFDSALHFIQAGPSALAAAQDLLNSHRSALPLEQARLLAPLLSPPRIFGIGLNYAEHAAESQMQVQTVPTVFLKLPSSITGPDSDIVLPRNATQPDYEAELAVVIGRPGYRISAQNWQEHVFGYTIVNDVSARDVQLATSQWTLGKSFPTFTPLGPCIVTREELEDPHSLDIRLTIDGEVLQNSNTRHLIFRIPQLIEYISSITPLEAGDVISTGTPQGVGLGRSPRRWLLPNEEVVISIANIGVLRNRTRAES